MKGKKITLQVKHFAEDNGTLKYFDEITDYKTKNRKNGKILKIIVFVSLLHAWKQDGFNFASNSKEEKGTKSTPFNLFCIFTVDCIFSLL